MCRGFSICAGIVDDAGGRPGAGASGVVAMPRMLKGRKAASRRTRQRRERGLLRPYSAARVRTSCFSKGPPLLSKCSTAGIGAPDGATPMPCAGAPIGLMIEAHEAGIVRSGITSLRSLLRGKGI